MLRYFIFISIQFGIGPNYIYGKQLLVFSSFPQDPYQIMADKGLEGKSIDTMNCIMNKLKKKFEIKIAPWKRSKSLIKKNKISGFFAVAHSHKIDEIAIFSNPLFLEKWYWFAIKPIRRSNIKKERIGAVLGSNTALWLEENGFPRDHLVASEEAAVKMLVNDRLDYVISNSQYMEKELKKQNVPKKIYSLFEKYTPLGVYFSKKLAGSKFLKEFNKKTFACSKGKIHLSSEEKTKLLKLAKRIKQWSANDIVIREIKKQNRDFGSIDSSRALELDAIWRAERNKDINERSMINKILSNTLSSYLKNVKLDSSSLYSEIFIMDQNGLNVGQSDITSDYWQGDEAKFKKTFGRGVDAILIDEIVYDESSKRFQSQISLTISETNKPIGAITVGVDIEHALSQK